MTEKKRNKDILREHKVDVEEFLREQNYLTDLSPDKQRTMVAKAVEVFNNEAFYLVVNHLINHQACESILQAPDSQRIMFHRAGINVLTLLKDEFKRLDGIYKKSNSPDEEYDKGEVI